MSDIPEPRLSHRVWQLWRRQLRPYWRDARPIVVVVAGIAVIVLGTIGYLEKEPKLNFIDALYRAVGLFGLAGSVPPPVPLELNVARILGPLVFGYAALQALLTLFRQEARLLVIRLFARDHVVIAGLGEKGFRIATCVHAIGRHVIVVERDAANPRIPGMRERGVTVLTGDATDPEMLRRAQVPRASHLLAVCGLDGTNIDVAGAAERLVETGALRTLNALVHLDDDDLWSMLASAGVGTENPSFRLEFFNLFALAAQTIVNRHPPFAPVGPHPPGLHVVVAGLDGVGRHLVLDIARAWRAARGHADQRLLLTIAGPGAGRHAAALRSAHPELDELCYLLAEEDVRAVPGRATATYVSLSDEADALTAALELRAGIGCGGPVVVAVADEDSGVARALRAEGRALGGIIAFGVLSHALTPELLFHGETEVLARAKHEEYRRGEAGRGLTEEENPSMRPWDVIPESLRDSNRRFADGISKKLTAAGCIVVPAPLVDPDRPGFAFTEDEVEELAKQEHDRWCEDLKRDGWKPTTGRKDAIHKLHPLLVEWDELSEDDRDRDRDPVREIPAMLARAGFRIVRPSPSRDGRPAATRAGSAPAPRA